jgi:hypothetical protein
VTGLALLGRVIAPWRAVWDDVPLRQVLLALVGSGAGSWMYIVGLSVYAYAEGGAVGVGIVQVARQCRRRWCRRLRGWWRTGIRVDW